MLQELKQLLGIPVSETSLDAKLQWILNAVTARLRMLLGGIDPPAEMNYIVVEVAAIRYNRIGSEGTKTHNVEGENQQFIVNEFDAFQPEIQAFLKTQNIADTRGGFRFL